MTTQYGVSAQTQNEGTLSRRLEELRVTGCTVVEDAVSAENLALARAKIDEVYARQVAELGADTLARLGETDNARCPLAYDPFFLTLASSPAVLELARAALGRFVVLHLQNAIINRPGQVHHQSGWHRDLPYQDWVSSKPLAVSALLCIDPFTVEMGATTVLPGSHRLDRLPSPELIAKLETPVVAPPGAAIVFDSMLYHRAGLNRSNAIRRGVNHVYVVPILKQQIDLPAALGGRFSDDPNVRELLGYGSEVPGSALAWRQRRLARL